jgi:glutamate 5-kinase
MHEMGMKERPASLHLLQACAAVGQRGLIQIYQNAFDKYNYKTAQVLISHDDISNRVRYLNAKSAIETLLSLNIIPIVNENDCVAIEEISFGDNDRLGAALVGLIRADHFIMLTDQEGIFSDDPTKDKEAKLLQSINLDDKDIDLSNQIKASAGTHGRGGMKTKLEAAKTSVNSGAKTWVADGRKSDILITLYEGKEEGTILLSKKDTLQSRKLWLSSFGSSCGTLTLDDGASEAITKKGRSVLPVGVTEVDGQFNRGDLITCLNSDSRELARGLSNFSSDELIKIKGLNSKDLHESLGYASEEEAIHRNNLVIS